MSDTYREYARRRIPELENSVRKWRIVASILWLAFWLLFVLI